MLQVLARRALLVALDGAIVAFSFYFALLLRADGAVEASWWPHNRALLYANLPWIVAVYLLSFLAGRLYTILWKYAGERDLIRLAGMIAVPTGIVYLVNRCFIHGVLFNSANAMAAVLIFLFIGGSRLAWRLFLNHPLGERLRGNTSKDPNRPVMIVGAGEAGAWAINVCKTNTSYGHVILAVDDDPNKLGQTIHGVPVRGTLEEIPDLCTRYNIHTIIVAGEAGGSTFYGGDLDGISEKLPYLKQLGVTALYLNPVFAAPSVHKYDTEDYRRVDPQFGGDAALLRLRHNTQRAGMRMILDGVFNHTGDSHPWFDRHQQGSGGAGHDPDSPWRDWFTFSEEGQAHNWLGYASLPKLDYRSTSLVNEIYAGEDSIVRHWLKAPWSMDGWRLDVVHMLGEGGGARNNLQHIAGITQAAKQAQPEAFVFGEHFGDARQWLQADAEDAAMNYRGFTFPIWGFLANTDISYDPQKIDAQTCMAWMDNYRAGLSHQQQLRMFNQLDSHDTARFKSLLGKDVARLPLAVVWLFTLYTLPPNVALKSKSPQWLL